MVFSPDGKYALIPNRESGNPTIIDSSHVLQGELRRGNQSASVSASGPAAPWLTQMAHFAYGVDNKTNDVLSSTYVTYTKKGAWKSPNPDGMAYFVKIA